VAALAQVSKQVDAAREGLPAGAAAKRDRGAEVRGAALIVKQTHVVVEVPLRLENSAADLAVESLGRGQCGHVASSSRRLAASAVGSALADPRLHGRLTEQLSIPLNGDEGTCQSPLRRGSQRQHWRSRDDLRHTHATLALQAGIHPKVVSERLGHATISITLDTYSHAIPAMQEEAAALIAGLVFAE